MGEPYPEPKEGDKRPLGAQVIRDWELTKSIVERLDDALSFVASNCDLRTRLVSIRDDLKDDPCKHEWRQYFDFEYIGNSPNACPRSFPNGFYCIHCLEIRKDDT